MFDVGFSEMVVIAIVALIVIGPERLPAVARTVGTLLGRLRRYTNDVKAEVNRELQLEDVRKMQRELAEQARGLEQKAQNQMSQISEIADVANASNPNALDADLKSKPEDENRIHSPQAPQQ
jgi:sec-independent protein translocase protein TatB